MFFLLQIQIRCPSLPSKLFLVSLMPSSTTDSPVPLLTLCHPSSLVSPSSGRTAEGTPRLPRLRVESLLSSFMGASDGQRISHRWLYVNFSTWRKKKLDFPFRVANLTPKISLVLVTLSTRFWV